MSLTVKWNEVLASGGELGQAILKNLLSLASTINTWQAKEHDASTGAHTAITPTNIACSDLIRTFRLGFDSRNFTVFNLIADGVVTVDKPYCVVKVNALAAASRVDGLFNDKYQVGDWVALINATDDNGATGTDLTLRLQSNAAANAQFRGNPGVVNDDKTWKAGRMVLLMRDRNSNGTATSAMYWRVCIL